MLYLRIMIISKQHVNCILKISLNSIVFIFFDNHSTYLFDLKNCYFLGLSNNLFLPIVTKNTTLWNERKVLYFKFTYMTLRSALLKLKVTKEKKIFISSHGNKIIKQTSQQLRPRKKNQIESVFLTFISDIQILNSGRCRILFRGVHKVRHAH